MAAPSIATEAIALKIGPSGETYQRLHLLSPDRGLIMALRRGNSKKKPSSHVDLYDQGEFQIELKPEGNIAFLKEFAPLKSRRSLSRSYSALEGAARLSHFFLANPIHEENRADVFALAEKALDALDAGYSKEAVLLKTYFVYSRAEGYPVSEEWLPSLTEELRGATTHLLRAPLSSLPPNEALHRDALAALSAYLERHAHIRLT